MRPPDPHVEVMALFPHGWRVVLKTTGAGTLHWQRKVSDMKELRATLKVAAKFRQAMIRGRRAA